MITPSEEDASTVGSRARSEKFNIERVSAIRRSMPAISQSTLRHRTRDDDAEFVLGQFEPRSRGGYARFTAVRAAAATANGRTSAKTR